MSPLPAAFSRTVLDAVLDLLIPLLLTAAGGDIAMARDAALELLDDYRPATREELGLAAEIVSFRFKALGALRDSSLPGTSNGAMLDLLKTASALRRNESTAQRKLDALQRARRKEAEQATTASRPDAVQTAHPHVPEPPSGPHPAVDFAPMAPPAAVPAPAPGAALDAAEVPGQVRIANPGLKPDQVRVSPTWRIGAAGVV